MTSTRGDRVVVVTGGSSGIGLATALALAGEGACLMLAARSEEALRRAVAECEAVGGVAVAVPTDVADADAVDALFTEATSRFGRVDAVVHAAAVLAYGRFEDVPAEVFDRVQTTNVTGTANVARGALGVFREQGHGRLVVVGSLLGKVAAPLMSTYVTSKWALHGLVRSLQIEARATPDIDITLVSPGGVDTPMYVQAGNYTGWQGRPPPPVDAPERVARAIVGALDRPRREVSVGLANGSVVAAFRLVPGLFDAVVTPVMRAGALSRERIEAHPGNVLRSLPEHEGLHGRWGRHWMRGVPVVGGVAALATATWRRLPRPADR
jgi:NAD(P)-dependent dehydrogenase (short-subunit alcohol dehydrogenase family)